MSVIAVVFLGVLEKARLGRWGHAMAEARGQKEESGRHDGGHVDVIVALTRFTPPTLHTNQPRHFWKRQGRWAAPVPVPTLTLHLDGARLGATGNYGVRVMSLVLDAMAGHKTVIGNYKQQNMQVVYDLDRAMLSFVPAQCDKLAASL